MRPTPGRRMKNTVITTRPDHLVSEISLSRRARASWAILTYRMLARIRQEHLLEVRTADRQDGLVCMQQLPIAGQGHVHQVATQE